MRDLFCPFVGNIGKDRTTYVVSLTLELYIFLKKAAGAETTLAKQSFLMVEDPSSKTPIKIKIHVIV